MVYNTLGFAAEVEEIDFCEVPVKQLAKTMRDAFDAGRASLSSLSHAAAASVHDNFQWKHATSRIRSELTQLEGQTPIRFSSSG